MRDLFRLPYHLLSSNPLFAGSFRPSLFSLPRVWDVLGPEVLVDALLRRQFLQGLSRADSQLESPGCGLPRVRIEGDRRASGRVAVVQEFPEAVDQSFGCGEINSG